MAKYTANLPKNKTGAKKLVDIALALVLLFVLGSCSSSLITGHANKAESSAPSSTATETSSDSNFVAALTSYLGENAEAAEEYAAEQDAERAVENGYYYTEWSESRYPEYYNIRGEASISYEVPANGGIVYGDLDEYGRTTYAAGLITRDMRAQAKSADRQKFDASCDTISGWGYNKETVIQSTNGSKPYNGWFYNRSHLIADSLGGAARPENLITGTRCQNVGNRDNNGGMAFVENGIRDYLDKGGSWVYYTATPVYEGDELVPRSVIVDVISDDGSWDAQIEVFNVAKGHEIDYKTGKFN